MRTREYKSLKQFLQTELKTYRKLCRQYKLALKQLDVLAGVTRKKPCLQLDQVALVEKFTSLMEKNGMRE